MDDLLELRKLHGNIFVSRLPNGQDVPWRPLSIQEYIEYDKLLKIGVYPPAYIEDEVFRKCVLSPVMVENLENLRAGIVKSVAMDILLYSGPNSVEELENFLNINRHEVSQVMHQLVSVVCQAFPAYKPEEVYAMDYATFALRVAQAEEKLLRTGLLQEYLTFTGSAQKPVQKPVRKEPEPPPPPKNAEEYQELKKDNLRSRWKAQQAAEVSEFAPPPPPKTSEQVIIKKADIIEHQSVMSGHEKDVVNHKQSAEETAAIYGDYLEQLKSGKPIKIKTPEERLEDAKKREEAVKQKLLEQKTQMLKDMAEERKKLLEVRQKERERRKKRGRKS